MGARAFLRRTLASPFPAHAGILNYCLTGVRHKDYSTIDDIMNASEGTGAVMHPPKVIAELNKNRAAFDLVKGQMEAEHWGKTVLLHDGNVVAIYNDEGDAYDIGCEKFGEGRFSIHLAGERPVKPGISLHIPATRGLGLPSFDSFVFNQESVVKLPAVTAIGASQMGCLSTNWLRIANRGGFSVSDLVLICRC